MKNKFIFIILIILLIGGYILFIKNSSPQASKSNFGSHARKLIPVSSIIHAHGMSVDSENSNNLYIATHHGLYLLKNDKDLFQVGDSEDDYMGFSANAKDAKTFFTSGHPKTGGNIGFEKSTDGGFTWSHISDVSNTPVDFHAMSVSPADPNLAYGWFQGKIYRTSDGGKQWQNFPTKVVIIALVADPTDENIVYALTPQGQGVLVSKNKGQDFQVLSEQLKGGLVSSLAINSTDNQQMLTFSETLGGLGKSTDGGKSWQKINEKFNNEELLYLAFAKKDTKIVYALTHLNSIYKSLDGGNTWKKIR